MLVVTVGVIKVDASDGRVVFGESLYAVASARKDNAMLIVTKIIEKMFQIIVNFLAHSSLFMRPKNMAADMLSVIRCTNIASMPLSRIGPA